MLDPGAVLRVERGTFPLPKTSRGREEEQMKVSVQGPKKKKEKNRGKMFSKLCYFVGL